jgi:hypothetical protein
MPDIINLEPFLLGEPAPGVVLHLVPNATMQVLEDVVNATWNLALDKSAAVDTKVAALSATNGLLDPNTAATVSAGSVTAPTVTAPNVTITDATVTDVFNTFTTEYIEVATWLTGQFTSFITTYCPDNTALYTAAEDSLQAALANNQYIPPEVISASMTQDRDRITADAQRAQADAIAGFSDLGYPVPPGAALAISVKTQRAAQDEIAESSRKLIMATIEQYRFVIGQSIEARKVMLNAAVDYVKALASAPDVVSKMSNIGYDAQQKMISAAASFYQADVSAKELALKASQFNSTAALDAAKANQATKTSYVMEQAKTAVAQIMSIGQQATALLNNLQVQVNMRAGGDVISSS